MGSFWPSGPDAEIRQGSFSNCLVVGRPKSREGEVARGRIRNFVGNGDELMTRSTSDVASSRASDSCCYKKIVHLTEFA
jgi:hypothetical protein